MTKGKKRKNKFSEKQIIKRNKRILRYSLISLALICLLIVSFFTYNTYSMWVQTFNQNDNNKVSSGCFELEINDLDENNESTAINLTNTYPMSETRGLATKPYKLNIKNICEIPSEYTIILNEFSNTNLTNDLIRYQIKKTDESTFSKLLSTTELYELDESLKYEIETKQKLSVNRSYKLADGYLNTNESVNYEIRIWLDYNATNDDMNKNFEAGIIVISTSPQ